MKPSRALLMALFFGITTLDCAAHREPVRTGAPGFVVDGPVALAPLENLSGNERAPEILHHFLEGALSSRGTVVVGSLEGSLPKERAPSSVELQYAGAKVGASFVLLGTVTEYRFREPARGAEPVPLISVQLKILDVASGRLVWEEPFEIAHGEGLGGASIALAARVAKTISPEPAP